MQIKIYDFYEKTSDRITIYHNGQEVVLVDELWNYNNYQIIINNEAKDTGLLKSCVLDHKKLKKIEKIQKIHFLNEKMYLNDRLKMCTDAKPFVPPRKEDYVIVAINDEILKAAAKQATFSEIDHRKDKFCYLFLKDNILRFSHHADHALPVKVKYPDSVKNKDHFVSNSHFCAKDISGTIMSLPSGKTIYMWLPLSIEEKRVIFSSGFNLIFLKYSNYKNNII